MLIDLHKKFIFIKTRKTAGTSIEIVLSRFMTPGKSVITPITPEDEILRQEYGGNPPEGFKKAKFPDELKKVVDRPSLEKGFAFCNHFSYARLRKILGPEYIESFWSFGFVRNPYDRALSAYTYRSRNVEGLSSMPLEEHQQRFEAFLKDNSKSTSTLLCSPDGGRVDTVYRYEDLESAMGTIATKLGIDPSQAWPLPMAKQQYGQALLPFPRAELLTDKAKQMIEKRCSWEFENYY